ncbi:MAG: glycerophosphodiester phosphodiesterase [Pseudomonadota bacterium]
MLRSALHALLLGMLSMSSASYATEPALVQRVLVIGHRGASALRPEHTLASYARAIADGADFIEPDLVMTRDGVMVARHENEIAGTTDVASHPEFAARRTTKVIDGHRVTGWFTEDFTLAELKTLRARERLPELRGTAYDGQFQVPTLDEIIDFTAAEAAARGRPVGLIPEIKHGTYFRGIGLPMEDKLLATLAVHAYTRTAPVEIQSFEIGNLKYLHDRLGKAHPNIRLLQLIDDPDVHPGDVLAAGGTLTYAQMTTPAGLEAIARYADAIGPDYRAIIPYTADGHMGRPTTLVRDAHAAGLEVHPYTFRPENIFLAKDFRQGSDPNARNAAGMVAALKVYLATGIDAFFTDDPALGRQAVDAR